MTSYERIKEMSVEEMAELLAAEYGCETFCAYKEFAEKLKQHKTVFSPSHLDVDATDYVTAVKTSVIDNLLKEMVGEEE